MRHRIHCETCNAPAGRAWPGVRPNDFDQTRRGGRLKCLPIRKNRTTLEPSSTKPPLSAKTHMAHQTYLLRFTHQPHTHTATRYKVKAFNSALMCLFYLVRAAPSNLSKSYGKDTQVYPRWVIHVPVFCGIPTRRKILKKHAKMHFNFARSSLPQSRRDCT